MTNASDSTTPMRHAKVPRAVRSTSLLLSTLSTISWFLGILGAQAPAATVKLVNFYNNQVAKPLRVKSPPLTWSGLAR
jgi:hypothetical protein